MSSMKTPNDQYDDKGNRRGQRLPRRTVWPPGFVPQLTFDSASANKKAAAATAALARRGAHQRVACPTCAGAPRFDDGEVCSRCGGTGKVGK